MAEMIAAATILTMLLLFAGIVLVVAWCLLTLVLVCLKR